MVTREKKATLKLNAWELLAVEKALELLQNSDEAHYTSVVLLIKKVRDVKL